MAMISFQTITPRRLVNKTRLQKLLRNTSKRLVEIAVLLSVLILFVAAAVNSLDNNIYPGCKILDQATAGNILEIRVDSRIDDGSDTGCYETAKLIRTICQDGYRVFYWGRVIDLDESEQLVAFTGEPIPIEKQ